MKLTKSAIVFEVIRYLICLAVAVFALCFSSTYIIYEYVPPTFCDYSEIAFIGFATFILLLFLTKEEIHETD